MRKAWVASLCALMWVCLSAGTLLAQNAEMERVPFCGTLSEGECAALNAAPEIMAGITSGTTENQIEVYLAAGSQHNSPLSLRLSSKTSFVASPETLDRFSELQSMTPEQLMADPTTVTEALLLPLSIDMDQAHTVAFSPELLARLSESLGTDIPATFSIHTRIVNQVIYLRTADFAVFGDLPEWMPEWIGVRMIELLSNNAANTVDSPEFDLTDVQDALDSLVTPGAALASGVVYHVPSDEVALYADFMHLTQSGTRLIDDQVVNVYTLSWNIPRYLSGPLFAQQSQFLSDSGHPNTGSRMLGMVGTLLLDGLLLETTQAVGVEDSFLYAVETRAEWAVGLPGGGLLSERPLIGFRSSTVNSDLNAIESIPVPSTGVVFSLDRILRLFNAMR